MTIVRFWPIAVCADRQLCVVMSLSASIFGWSNPLQSAVKSNANYWSGRFQARGLLRCNYAKYSARDQNVADLFCGKLGGTTRRFKRRVSANNNTNDLSF